MSSLLAAMDEAVDSAERGGSLDNRNLVKPIPENSSIIYSTEKAKLKLAHLPPIPFEMAEVAASNTPLLDSSGPDVESTESKEQRDQSLGQDGPIEFADLENFDPNADPKRSIAAVSEAKVSKAKQSSKIMASADLVDQALKQKTGSDINPDGHKNGDTTLKPVSDLRKAYSGGQTLNGATATRTDLETGPKSRGAGPVVAAMDELPSLFAGNEDDPLEDDDLAGMWDMAGVRHEEMADKARREYGRISEVDPMQQPIRWEEVETWISALTVDPDVLQPLSEQVDDHVSSSCCLPKQRATLHQSCINGKDLVLFLYLTKFEWSQPVHYRMLRTMYCKLTGNKICPTIGEHWKDIGFQGTNPDTDLNRCGHVLNVVHLFFFFSKYTDQFKSMHSYLLCQDPDHQFELILISISITRMVVDALLGGRLTQLLNKSDKGVVDTTCHLQAAGLFYFYSRWKMYRRTTKCKPIAKEGKQELGDVQITLQEVAYMLKKKPAKLNDDFDQGMLDMKSNATKLQWHDGDFGSNQKPSSKTSTTSSNGAPAIPKRWSAHAAGPDTDAVQSHQ